MVKFLTIRPTLLLGVSFSNKSLRKANTFGMHDYSTLGARGVIPPTPLQPPPPPPRSCTVVNSDVNSETVSSASNFCLLPEKPPNPSKDFVFAKLKFGFPYPSWQHNWFDNYPWLHYDIEKDCVFCFYCMKNVSKLTAEKKQRTSMHIGRI